VLNYGSYEKKRCKKCSYSLQKWGKNSSGSQRYHCSNCCSSQTGKRPELTKANRHKLFKNWLLGKQSLTEIAQKYLVTRQTIHYWFIPFWNDEPLPQQVNITNQVLIIDGKYVAREACVLVARTLGGVVSWSFTGRETAGSWLTFLDTLKQFPFAVVCDGQRGMLKAIKLRFPGVIIQRCQFHIISYCLTKLTKHPESLASQEFRTIIKQVSKVKTKEEFKIWLGDYMAWRKTHNDFLKEKTYQEDSLTPTGRKKWHYTHGKLHAAHSHLKNSIPHLFKYLLYPQIPNTTNLVEGGINASMQEKLRFHRGLKLSKQRVLIAYFLRSKQC